MKWTTTDAAPAGATHHDRDARAIAVAAGCGEVGEHVEAARDEVDELDLADRPHPHVRGTDRGTDDRLFRDRRIDNPRFAVLFDQPFGGLERATVGADVFADQKDALVARHFFEEGLADGFEVGDYGHGDCTNSSVGSA